MSIDAPKETIGILVDVSIDANGNIPDATIKAFIDEVNSIKAQSDEN